MDTEELRGHAAILDGHGYEVCPAVIRSAAAEIDKLRAEVRDLRAANMPWVFLVQWLNETSDRHLYRLDRNHGQVARWCCEIHSGHTDTIKMYATTPDAAVLDALGACGGDIRTAIASALSKAGAE